MKFIALIAFTIFAGCSSVPSRGFSDQVAGGSFTLPVETTLRDLLRTDDTDLDHKITIHDGKELKFVLQDSKSSSTTTVRGHYALSILLQELGRAKAEGKNELNLRLSELSENPTTRTGRLIRDYFWDGLTRRLDADGLPRMIDSKASSSAKREIYLYTPSGDLKARKYYGDVAKQIASSGVRMHVKPLPRIVTAEFVRRLDGKHGILSLALEKNAVGKITGATPFVVPGGRFNEMYGWDSYFIILGLLADGKVELAKAQVDNLVYEINHYGKILNANRTYYLTRSQPPFTTSAIEAVYGRLPKDRKAQNWFRASMRAALKEYRAVWMSKPRLVNKYGLSRYDGEGLGPCPEVEPGHYDKEVRDFLGGLTMAEVTANYEKNPDFRPPDPRLGYFFRQDRALRESGHDTTYRFDDRATDFLTVDLNSLLYKTEADFAAAIDTGDLAGDEFGSSAAWQGRASLRKERMVALMYDAESGLFYDYDMTKQKKSMYLSATTFYVLWAKLLDRSGAEQLTKSALRELSAPGGISATSARSLEGSGHAVGVRQWDYPYGWPPHQMLAWQGLLNYGLNTEARDLAGRWIKMISDNARDFNGTVPEKFDVVKRSHEVFAEYGNVGTQFDYITKEGFGWMNASFEVGVELLAKTPSQR